MEQQKTLFLETGLNWLTAKARENKIPLLASFLFGLLAYGFHLTNKLINHDEAAMLFEKGATISSGRWGLNILERIFPNVSMPWIYGIITIALVAAAVCLICRMFQIKSRLLQILLSGSILVFPSLIGTFAYMFTSSAFGLSFFMAVLAVFWIRKPTKYSILPALCAMIFSLGIYQSYISLAAGLLVLLLIQQLLLDADVKTVFRRGVVYLFFLILSLVGYFIATKVFQRILNVGFNGYASQNMCFSLASLPAGIVTAYGNFFRFFTEGYEGLMPTSLSRFLHLALLAAIAVLLLFICFQKKRDLPRLLLLAILVGLLPLAVNCMYMFTTEDAVHTLVLYGFVSFYVLAVLLADLAAPAALLRRIAVEIISIAMAVIVVCNIYIANESSLNLHLRYENAYAFYTSLVADIKMQPEFDENTRLALVGNYRSPDFYYYNFQEATSLTGTAGFFPDNYSNARFVEYYLGFPIPFADYEECQAIAATPEYADMAVYPYYGSMKFFGDVLVVKLS